MTTLNLCLEKALDNIILHVCTNDAPNSACRAILDNMLSLKSFTGKALRYSNVCISNVVKRADNGKAKLTLNKVNEHLSPLQLDIVDNSNINFTGLSPVGLHLSQIGTSELSVN